MKFKVGDEIVLTDSGVDSAADLLYDIIRDMCSYESLCELIQNSSKVITERILSEDSDNSKAYMVGFGVNIYIDFEGLIFSYEMEKA